MHKEGSKHREDDGILRGQTRESLQTLKTEITVSILQNFTKLDTLHNDRVTRRCCRSTDPLTEASGFLFAQISLEWFNEPISAEADTRQPVETQNRAHFIRNKTRIYHIHNWSPGIHISQLSSIRMNHVNIRIWCPIINVPPALE